MIEKKGKKADVEYLIIGCLAFVSQHVLEMVLFVCGTVEKPHVWQLCPKMTVL